MKLPTERAALIRLVSAAAKLVVVIGRAIHTGVENNAAAIDAASEEFVDAAIGVDAVLGTETADGGGSH